MNMAAQANNLTGLLQQLAVITFRVDDILEATNMGNDGNKRGKLYSGYETMRRMMLDLLVSITEESATKEISNRAEG